MTAMTAKHGIQLVLGISGVGKSSYIQSRMDTGDWTRLPLFLAHELKQESGAERLARACVVHYNLFRPFKNNAENLANDLLSDPVLVRLLEHRSRIRAYFLVTHRSELSRRWLRREAGEPGQESPRKPYPRQQLFDLLSRVDSPAFHSRWFSLFRERQIQFEMIDSTSSDYATLPSEAAALALCAEPAT